MRGTPVASEIEVTGDKVSVVVNCYNGEEFVAQALESVLKQTHQNFEL